MTATNHALTGAAIALAVKKPEFAIPLAFISHFVLDALPHYEPKGIQSGLNSGIQKMKNPAFKIFLATDIFLFIIILTGGPIAFSNHVQWWLILVCSFLGAAPDLTWGRHFYRAKIGKKIINPSSLSRFHIWVQWMERPWGIIVELVWFILMVWLVDNLIG